jgi:hypothetical protein
MCRSHITFRLITFAPLSSICQKFLGQGVRPGLSGYLSAITCSQGAREEARGPSAVQHGSDLRQGGGIRG